MKITATREPQVPVFTPVTLTFVVENEAELTLFQALAEQTHSGPLALNEKAFKFNKENTYAGYRPYTQIAGVSAYVLDKLRAQLRSLDLFVR